MYHWSPSPRFSAIRNEGLIPGKPVVTCAEPAGVISVSPDPMAAWTLSGGVNTEHEHWDLWMVRLDGDDEVHASPSFGPFIREVQIHNPIGPERLWHVGSRYLSRPGAENGFQVAL